MAMPYRQGRHGHQLPAAEFSLDHSSCDVLEQRSACFGPKKRALELSLALKGAAPAVHWGRRCLRVRGIDKAA